MKHTAYDCGCSLKPEKLYDNKFYRLPDIDKKAKWKYVKPPYWNPPTIYQRSFMPVKTEVERAGPPLSTWKRPTDLLDGITTYTHDYSLRVIIYKLFRTISVALKLLLALYRTNSLSNLSQIVN